jgi:hypothetical protein
VRTYASLVLSLIAVAIGWFGLQINAWYGETLGKSAEASILLAGLSISADVLALVLPTTARVLRGNRQRAAAGVAWGLMGCDDPACVLGNGRFAALNISDTTATRNKIATEGALLTERIERLRGLQRIRRPCLSDLRAFGTPTNRFQGSPAYPPN